MKKTMILPIVICLLTACGHTGQELPFGDSGVLREISVSANPASIRGEEGRILWKDCEIRQEEKHLLLAAVGDVMLGRRVGALLDEKGRESAYEGFSFLFNEADAVFGNLESPLSDRGEKLKGKGIWLRASPDKADLLKEAGFTVLSLANNHILDYGDEALFDTLDLLDIAGISRVGAGRDIEEARQPEIFQKGDVSMGFLAYHEFSYYFWSYDEKRRFAAEENKPGTAPMDIEPLLQDVRALAEKVDIVVVSLHWGIEESNTVTEEQRRLAHAIIDAGADVILGHHPHVIQGIEIYRNRPVFYSLGNYIFDQNDENNKQGMAVGLRFYEGKLTSMEAYPLYVSEKRAPVVPEGEKKREILFKILRLSKALGTTLEEAEGVLTHRFGGIQ